MRRLVQYAMACDRKITIEGNDGTDFLNCAYGAHGCKTCARQEAEKEGETIVDETGGPCLAREDADTLQLEFIK